MPELPEVETTRRSLEAPLVGRRVTHVVVRDRRLRWPIEPDFERHLTGASIRAVGRRAKYLLVVTDRGTAMIHLGMSGSLVRVPGTTPVVKHDHVDIVLDDDGVLRFHDPRRFGSIHWIDGDPASHPLLASLAPEPSDAAFDGAYLHRITRGRSVAIKHVLMNGQLVTGVGNIYASEALHAAAIDPKTAAKRLSRERCDRLVAAVTATLARAIEAGGSSLRDYVDGAGNAGHFQTESAVYGREGLACPRCDNAIRLLRQGQRATYWCAGCQT